MVDPVELASIVAGSIIFLTLLGWISADSLRRKMEERKANRGKMSPYREDVTRHAVGN